MSEPLPNPRTSEDDSLIQGRNWFSAGIERWIAQVTPNCQRVVRMISESMDRPADLRTRVTLRTHYLVCCYCRRYAEQLHRLRRFTIALPEHIDEATSEPLDDAVKQRMKERLRSPHGRADRDS